MYKKLLTLVLALSFALLPLQQTNASESSAALTREELADSVMEAYEYITQEFSIPTSERQIFSDTNQSRYQMRIVQSYLNGFMNGVGDEKFAPEDVVTRSEAATVLDRLINCLNIKYDTDQAMKTINIYDIEDIPDWARQSAVYMSSTGFMPLNDGRFYPNNPMDKTELTEIIERIKGTFVKFNDVERIDFQTFLERMQQK